MGKSVDAILSEFDDMERQCTEFNFNSNQLDKNGVTKGIWRTTGDEKVRPSHDGDGRRSFRVPD